MPLPFKSKPRQTYIPVGDDAIGILHFPQKWGLTPNEINLIEEATKDHQGLEKRILDFAEKIFKKLKKDIESADFSVNPDKTDIANSVLRFTGLIKLSEEPAKREQQEELDEFLFKKLGDSKKDAVELTETLDTIKKQGIARKNAYIQAAMVYRFDNPDWDFEWGCDIKKCPEEGWSEPLAFAVYQQMQREEQGPQFKNGKRVKGNAVYDEEKQEWIEGEEIISDKEFKGFTPESVKKPAEEASQKEPIGAGSSG